MISRAHYTTIEGVESRLTPDDQTTVIERLTEDVYYNSPVYSLMACDCLDRLERLPGLGLAATDLWNIDYIYMMLRQSTPVDIRAIMLKYVRQLTPEEVAIEEARIEEFRQKWLSETSTNSAVNMPFILEQR
jgi:hypothetical protein